MYVDACNVSVLIVSPVSLILHCNTMIKKLNVASVAGYFKRQMAGMCFHIYKCDKRKSIHHKLIISQ